MNPLTEAALQYLAEGHHLLALHEKRPNSRYHAKPVDSDDPGWSWDRSIRPSDDGLPLTALDIEQLDGIFSDPSTTGIALLIPEHVLVADVDTEEAAALYLSLAGAAPRTRMAKTTKGYHVWFQAWGADASVWLGNRVLLFKGLGGYVAAPPSAHFNDDGVQDGSYAWLDDGPMDLLPEGFARALADARAVASLTPVRFGDDDAGAGTHCEWDSSGRLTAMWPEWHIEGLLKAIREAPDGNQNNVIAWAALTAAEEGVSFEYAKPLLLQAALDGGHPRRRAVSTINGAFKRRRGG